MKSKVAAGEFEVEKDQGDGITDYEKQRLQRLQENHAKLQALGIPALATAAAAVAVARSEQKVSTGSTKTGKKKRKQHQREHDSDYEPTHDEDEEEDEEKEGDDKLRFPAHAKRSRAKNYRTKAKKMKSLDSLPRETVKDERTYVAFHQADLDDGAALQQALALSMGASMEDALAIAAASTPGLREQTKDGAGKKPNSKSRRLKDKTQNMNSINLLEDEALAYFLLFDGTGRGNINVRDLERVAVEHDFNWSKQELNEMINIFDTDQDGKLSFGEFQTILARCNLTGTI